MVFNHLKKLGSTTRVYATGIASDEEPVSAQYRLIRSLLSVLSVVYGGSQKLRSDIYRRGWRPVHRLPCMVISIGNLVAGGTGKTPMTYYVAALSRRLRYKVMVVSRGYRGRAERRGGVVSDGATLLMSSENAGDEPFMLASALTGIPVIVGRDRFRSGILGVDRFQPDMIILDDGFQHLRLKRDLDILLLDGCRPFGNGYLLPRGTLREPATAIQRADAVVLTRTDAGRIPLVGVNRYLGDRPLFRSSHQPVIDSVLPSGRRLSPSEPDKPVDPGYLDRRRIFVFSGIARNDDFHQSVRRLGGTIVGHQDFPDHYNYHRRDFSIISREAVAAGSDCIVTTAKDYVRIGQRVSFPLDLVVVNVAMTFADNRFDTFLADKLENIIRNKVNRSSEA